MAGRARCGWARVLRISCWLRGVDGVMGSHVGFKQGRDVARVGVEWRPASLLKRDPGSGPGRPASGLPAHCTGEKLRPRSYVRHREDLSNG